ncbi:MAG: 4Fe-4S binding protein [Oscillospiraceae bacterium]|nr:4Fe-4S binding protein [Oscillospiraceae bacterium]
MKRTKKPIPAKKRQAYLRAVIQLLFFLFFPAAFTTAFSAVKNIFTQMGSGAPLVWSTFLTVFVSLCAFTIVFGRFFCGYACAFGALGDAVRSLYVWICKKCKKKPITLKFGKKPFYLIKYLILLLIVIFCFTGVYGTWKGWNPWDVFSMLRAGNWHLGGDWIGIVLLLAIVVGMAFCERFFCRFLCPLGAVFSLLPILPVFSVRRKRENCAKGCSACQRCCPAELTLPEAGSWSVSGECFQCQKCVDICPRKNAHSGFGVVQGNAVWFTILQAGILAVVMILAGV